MPWTESDAELERQQAEQGLPSARSNGTRPPPSDEDAERYTLGAVMLSGLAAQTVRALGLQAWHFYRTSHGLIWEAVTHILDQGGNPDATLVGFDLTDHGQLEDVGGQGTLTALTAEAPGTSNATVYAARVIQHAQFRQLIATAGELRDAAWSGDTDRITRTLLELNDPGAITLDGLGAEDLAAFCDSTEPAYDWAISGLLEHGDRVMLTGPEGGGKSTLLRQIAVQAAAGIHPFTLDPIDPLTVLLVDLENGRRHVTRALRPLRLAAGHQADHRLHIAVHPEGLDIGDPIDARRLEQLIDTVQPDLVCGGPVYKMVGGDPVEEGPAKAAALTMDRLRTTHGFALLLETHQPHESGSKSRVERPYGASLWKRWPEFGLHLAATGPLRHWRGARDERAWPAHLQRGGAWPWTVAETPADPRGGTFEDYRRDIVAHLGDHPDVEWTQARLEDALMDTYHHPRSGIRKALDELVTAKRIERNLGTRRAKVYSLSRPRLTEKELEEF